MDKITLTFATTAGDLEDDFAPSQPLHAVKTTIMARLKLDPSQADQFVVTRDGNPLDDSKTLAELGLTDSLILALERHDVVKI